MSKISLIGVSRIKLLLIWHSFGNCQVERCQCKTFWNCHHPQQCRSVGAAWGEPAWCQVTRYQPELRGILNKHRGQTFISREARRLWCGEQTSHLPVMWEVSCAEVKLIWKRGILPSDSSAVSGTQKFHKNIKFCSEAEAERPDKWLKSRFDARFKHN